MTTRAPANSMGIRKFLRQESTEYVPILLWQHFNTDDPRILAQRTVDYYHEFRTSAAKVMPDVPILFKEGSLSSWEQLAQIRRLGPIHTVGRAAEYVRTVELTRSKLDDDDVLLVTIFSPLTMIGLWCGGLGMRKIHLAAPARGPGGAPPPGRS